MPETVRMILAGEKGNRMDIFCHAHSDQLFSWVAGTGLSILLLAII